MKLSAVCCTLALALGTIPPAMAQDHAILGPRFGQDAGNDPAARAVIRRAGAALDRPPGAVPQLHTEGTLPGQGIRDASLQAKQDQPIVLDLALAWRLTGDRRYLDQAGRYLEAWVDTYRMSFNPIDETGFDALILATDLTEADLPAPLQDKLQDFWRRMASGYLDAMEGKARNSANNWQSHRVKLATMAAYAVGDPGLISRARQAFRRQVTANIRPDGSTLDFEQRDALHYVTYDLDPLLMAALAAKAHGEDWIDWKSPAGSSLAGALDWLEPYATGGKAHVDFVNSTVPFDRQRAAAGESAYVPRPWKAGSAVNTFAMAALVDPAYRDVAAALASRTGSKPADWVSLYAR
ncbi:alginate lyase family protein [Sphingomonas cannabina]|uniref:alginate lyase family protein n=1 Tax=Sphingomonas cannabina TaxID=2899123 RepID=UPI001F166BFB|nr:alginate lyase family protein [Sphingomonas cannabina]UIJ45502.1 alginate lyase family protein [Sphingomonas cannabina]